MCEAELGEYEAWDRELLTCQLVSAGSEVMLMRKAVRLGRGAVRSWK